MTAVEIDSDKNFDIIIANVTEHNGMKWNYRDQEECPSILFNYPFKGVNAPQQEVYWFKRAFEKELEILKQYYKELDVCWGILEEYR
jgi:hypothetical protein